MTGTFVLTAVVAAIIVIQTGLDDDIKEIITIIILVKLQCGASYS
jgi:hypothetical protein